MFSNTAITTPHLSFSGPLRFRSKIAQCTIELRNQFNIGSPRRFTYIILYNTTTIYFNRVYIIYIYIYIHDNGFLSCTEAHSYTHTHNMLVCICMYKRILLFIVAIRVEPVSVIVLRLSEQGKKHTDNSATAI